MSYYLGLDLGGTNIKSALVDHQGTMLSRVSTATRCLEGPDAVIAQMIDLALEVVSQANLRMDQVDAVGVGTPGLIDFEAGVLAAAPNLPEFRDVPIRDRIAQAIGCPAVLENDANAAAFGEYWIGAGREASVRHLVVMTLGTGVGGGLVVDGQIVHGGFGSGGEVGHMIVVPNGRRCGCGQRGCLEIYASASHTAQWAIEAIEKGHKSVLDPSQWNLRPPITAKDVFEAAKAGDELALRIVDQTTMYLGVACVNLCRLVDPQMIVLAGGMIQAGDFLLSRVIKSFNDHSWEIAKPNARIVLAQLGRDAGVIGAAAVAWDAHHHGRLG